MNEPVLDWRTNIVPKRHGQDAHATSQAALPAYPDRTFAAMGGVFDPAGARVLACSFALRFQRNSYTKLFFASVDFTLVTGAAGMADGRA